MASSDSPLLSNAPASAPTSPPDEASTAPVENVPLDVSNGSADKVGNGTADGDVVDIEEFEREFTRKYSVTLAELLRKLDDKGLRATVNYIKVLKESKLKKSTAEVIIGHTDSVVVDFEALVKKLREEDSATLADLIKKLDSKELQAAGKYINSKTKRPKLESKWWCSGDREVRDTAIDTDLRDAALPQCYEEIKRLLDIEENPVYAKALQEWSRKEALLADKSARKKSAVADTKNVIYQLLGIFSAFQGLLLTAVSQSNLLDCDNSWSPIGLSLFASAVTILAVAHKYMNIADLQSKADLEEEFRKEVEKRINKLCFLGKDAFEFAQFPELVPKEPKLQITVSFCLVIGTLVLFTVWFPLSLWRILCH